MKGDMDIKQSSQLNCHMITHSARDFFSCFVFIQGAIFFTSQGDESQESYALSKEHEAFLTFLIGFHCCLSPSSLTLTALMNSFKSTAGSGKSFSFSMPNSRQQKPLTSPVVRGRSSIKSNNLS